MTRYADTAAASTSITKAMERIRERLPAFGAAENADLLADALAKLSRLDTEAWEVADALDEALYGHTATR